MALKMALYLFLFACSQLSFIVNKQREARRGASSRWLASCLWISTRKCSTDRNL